MTSCAETINLLCNSCLTKSVSTPSQLLICQSTASKCGRPIVPQFDCNKHIDIEHLELDCFIICIPIGTLFDLIVYSPCNHYFSRDAIIQSCETAIAQGMTTQVHKCPICITEHGGKPEMESAMGTIPYHVLESMLSAEVMARLGR